MYKASNAVERVLGPERDERNAIRLCARSASCRVSVLGCLCLWSAWVLVPWCPCALEALCVYASGMLSGRLKKSRRVGLSSVRCSVAPASS
jgi:hypothetical protein